MSRRRCRSFRSMIWSRISRRQLPTQRSRNPVLPRCLNTCPLRSQARGFQKCDHFAVEFRIIVQDEVTIRTGIGKRFPQLLHHPLGVRAASYVEVQDPATPVFNDKEAIQQLEGERGHSEEVDRHDCLLMIGKEGEPPFAGITAPPEWSQVPGDRAFGDFEAELQQFTMDLGCAPIGISTAMVRTRV